MSARKIADICELSYEDVRRIEDNSPSETENKGLHILHGWYPAFTASSLLEKDTLFEFELFILETAEQRKSGYPWERFMPGMIMY